MSYDEELQISNIKIQYKYRKDALVMKFNKSV